MLGVVIESEAVWMVDEGCPNAFEYRGGWYVRIKDYDIAKDWYLNGCPKEK